MTQENQIKGLNGRVAAAEKRAEHAEDRAARAESRAESAEQEAQWCHRRLGQFERMLVLHQIPIPAEEPR
jgi:predicted  nucleic acid-binding Zn-ribbon protein